MTKDEISNKMNPDYPGIYIPTTEPTQLIFKDGKHLVGFFDFRDNSPKLELQNKYTFIESGQNAIRYRESQSDEFVTIINGVDLVDVEFPAKGNLHFENYSDIEINDESNVPIKIPFDPNLIRIRRDPYTLGELIDRIEHNEINFLTGFQRKYDLWSPKQQCGLIESILLRLPLPAFYFDESEDDKWQVIDGLQRTSAIRNFVVDKKLELQDLEFLEQFNGYKFAELPRELHRRIKTTPLTVYVVEKGTPDEVKFNIFKRINTGGLILTPQEIRHALNQGIVAKFIEDLAGIRAFKEATCWKINPDRMEDRDFITRFISFYLIPYQEYEPDLDSFMTKGMNVLKTKTNEENRNRIKLDFIKAMETSIAIFGIDAFRKRKGIDDRRKPINKALFESFSVAFSQLSSQNTHLLIERSDKLKAKFIELNNEPKFENSISSGTGQKESVYIRYSEIKRIINDTLIN